MMQSVVGRLVAIFILLLVPRLHAVCNDKDAFLIDVPNSSNTITSAIMLATATYSCDIGYGPGSHVIYCDGSEWVIGVAGPGANFPMSLTPCDDIDECATAVCGSAGCKNHPGTYECICPPGEFWNGRECTDPPVYSACGNPGDFEHAHYDPLPADPVTSMTSINVTCDLGWQISPGVIEATLTCDGGPLNGWTLSDTCVDVDECKDASICRANGMCVNGVGSYECDCPNGFTWHGDLATGYCTRSIGVPGIPVDCGDPGIDPHAHHVVIPGRNTFSTDYPVQYECSAGFHIMGKDNTATTYSKTCEADGRWSGGAKCVEISCGPPGDRANAVMTSVSDFTSGDQVIFTCKRGYSTETNKASLFIITCGKDGKWSAMDECVGEDSEDRKCIISKSGQPICECSPGEDEPFCAGGDGNTTPLILAIIALILASTAVLILGLQYCWKQTGPPGNGRPNTPRYPTMFHSAEPKFPLRHLPY